MTYQFETAAFHPWIGNTYDSSYFGLKLLVMGESHYEGGGGLGVLSETTRIALRQGRDRGRFWRGLEDLITNAAGYRRGRGWDDVAFYNYVQHFVGRKPRDRPKEWMWTSEATVAGFKEVLRVCVPDRILIVGKTNWVRLGGAEQFPDDPPVPEPRFNLPESFCNGIPETDRSAYWYPTSPGSFALCAPIFHPAYPRGFHDPGTKQVLAKLLDSGWVRRSESKEAILHLPAFR
jgi:hypothetical protein